MTSKTSRNALIGHAGEHYVISELYKRGLLAALAPQGTDTSDVLVLASDGESTGCSLQVKTRSRPGRTRGWLLSSRHEHIRARRLLYVFVDFSVEPTDAYIVPSDLVADAVTFSHQSWLAGAPRLGTTRKDTAMRTVRSQFQDDVEGFPPGWLEKWRGRWDLIEELVTQPVGDASAM